LGGRIISPKFLTEKIPFLLKIFGGQETTNMLLYLFYTNSANDSSTIK